MVYLQRWHGWCHIKLQLSRCTFCVHHTTVHHVTSCKATYIRCMGLAVTCHLHFWQNDWDLLRATSVTWGWNGYQNKSQHRKSTMEKKILPLLLQGFKPATFQSQVQCSNHWAVPAPRDHSLRICLVSSDRLLWPEGLRICLVSSDRLLWPKS